MALPLETEAGLGESDFPTRNDYDEVQDRYRNLEDDEDFRGISQEQMIEDSNLLKVYKNTNQLSTGQKLRYDALQRKLARQIPLSNRALDILINFDPRSLYIEPRTEVPDDANIRDEDRDILVNSLLDEREADHNSRIERLDNGYKMLLNKYGVDKEDPEKERSNSISKSYIEEEIIRTNLRASQEEDVKNLDENTKGWNKDRVIGALRGLAELVIAALLIFKKFAAAVVSFLSNVARGAYDFAKSAIPFIGNVLKTLGNGAMGLAKLVAWVAQNLWVLLIIPLVYFLKR